MVHGCVLASTALRLGVLMVNEGRNDSGFPALARYARLLGRGI
jgi:hypothetical protein